MTSATGCWSLFEAIGIEIEYMVVDEETLDVLPVVDRILAGEAGTIVSELERGELAWSNELVLHVVELKTNGPATDLAPLPALFREHVHRVDELARALGGRLMPTAMHPWMDPERETVLWPHEHSPVYEAYDRIFGCRGHGWSNLQSIHLNLPFAGDEEFGRLHAGIRLVLPLIPALAASSPIWEGRFHGALDSRMTFYRTNSAGIPQVAGQVVPEPVFTRDAYQQQILLPMFDAIAPHDPGGVLREEFLNSRGAIPRFDRGSIEIRVVDTQEHPEADLAIAAAVCATLRMLASERWARLEEQQAIPVAPLAELLLATSRDGEAARVEVPALLRALGRPTDPVPAGELWRAVLEDASRTGTLDRSWEASLQTILDHGTLARRILAATGPEPARNGLIDVYRELCDCLLAGRAFLP